MDRSSYNGWSNYETWAMALWIDNDQGSYSYSREIVREYARTDDNNICNLADALKDWQEEQMPELDASVWSDLLNAAFGEVDWFEIAESYLSEIKADA